MLFIVKIIGFERMINLINYWGNQFGAKSSQLLAKYVISTWTY
jgi:hypothetical protein